MAKFQSPLLGYNNNVRHKNRVFHIQTEDSGVNHPHIITHLFMDGGRILKSVKKSYAEHVGADGMQETVRGLMKEQHKAIFVALRDGQFDELVDGGASTQTKAKAGSIKPPPAAPAASEVKLVDPPSAAAVASATPASAESVAALIPAASEELVVAAPVVEAPAPAPHASEPVVVPAPPTSSMSTLAAAEQPLPDTKPEAPVVEAPKRSLSVAPTSAPDTRRDAASRSGRELTLDFDALEEAAQDGGIAPSLFHAADLPPPPKNLFAAKEPGSGGTYRAVEGNPAHANENREPRTDARQEPRTDARHDARQEPDSSSGPVSKPHPRAMPRVPSSRPQAEGRYAPARPAAIFGSTHRPPPASLFSDDLVSDKSLDEVILSYLAEDLEPPRRK